MTSSTRITMVRFFFPLPEVIGVPDALSFTEAVGSSSQVHGKALEDPIVSVIYHQAALLTDERPMPILRVVTSLYPELTAGLKEDVIESLSVPLAHSRRHTIVEALTSVPRQPLNDPQTVVDALGACLRLVEDHVRAYQLSTNRAVALPAMPVILHRLVAFAAEGVRLVERGAVKTTVEAEWIPLALEHSAETDNVLTPSGPASPKQFAYWMREIRSGNPLLVWRDRLFAATRSNASGDYVTTVLHCATAAEVLINRLLLMLCWEEKMTPADAAAKFVEGQMAKRLQGELAPRLGGRWQPDQPGPVHDWYHSVSRLRNRVIHGGYTPSEESAGEALRATRGLETFAFDRLSAHRNEYPRSTLMTIAPEGLDRRDLWNGKIRYFVESGAAEREPNWQTDFRAWRDLVDQHLT